MNVGFYVTMIRSPKLVALLAGPFAEHSEALAMVDRARDMACKLDQWAWFYRFGTSRMEPALRQGVLNDQLGVFDWSKLKPPVTDC